VEWDTSRKLELWWSALSPAQQVKLLPLLKGDEVPSGHLIALTNALSVGPAGARWEHDGYTYRVDARLSAFLEHRRGGT
jgi:hypothetical protein